MAATARRTVLPTYRRRRPRPSVPQPHRPRGRLTVPIDRSAPALLRAVGLMPDGPGQWGRPSRASGGGAFLVELPVAPPTASLSHARIGRWLEHVPELRLDGARPTGRELLARLASFW